MQLLQKYENSKIAIYGLGTETEKVLHEIAGRFHVIGLLDGYKTDGILYGMPIIPLTEAIERQVKLILVVARPGSCKAIAKRIGKRCVEAQIDLLDVRGRDLCAVPKITYDFQGSAGITREQLWQKIQENDVLSVDLFDTLIVRKTLLPTDVFELVDYRLKERGIFIEDFCGKRLESEKNLGKSAAPTLCQIYFYMKETYSLPEIMPEELAELEWSIDCELLIPRQELCALIAEAYEQGKEVYIVSDTYYTKKQLLSLLHKLNIVCYTDVFASCDYGTGKLQKLFEQLLNRVDGKSCLHIGDDIAADVESPGKYGIVSCQIYSVLELLEMVGYLGLWDCLERPQDRIKAGMFAARLFNSPFQFETEKREITVDNAYDIGYLLFAPIISDFVIWFGEQVKQDGIKNIWFGARDGYLIQKMYDAWKQDTPSSYFLISRTAAIRAGIENKEDLEYVGGMKFSGTLREQIWKRFGVSIVDEKKGGALLDYSEEILACAAMNRENYKHYIKGMEIREGDIAFFDFVAKGTSQMYLSRLLENHLKGLYFLRLEEESMCDKGLDILPFYQKEEMENSAIFENYYILETMLTSPEPSVQGFDEQGTPVYAEETRNEKDIQCFQSAQEGIFDYFTAYLSLCPNLTGGVNKKLDEQFLALIHNLSILDKDFLNLKVEDPFFNRMTDMTDLL